MLCVQYTSNALARISPLIACGKEKGLVIPTALLMSRFHKMTVITQYNLIQINTVRLCVYMPHFLGGGSPKALHSHFPAGLKGNLPGHLSQLLLVPSFP